MRFQHRDALDPKTRARAGEPWSWPFTAPSKPRSSCPWAPRPRSRPSAPRSWKASGRPNHPVQHLPSLFAPRPGHRQEGRRPPQVHGLEAAHADGQRGLPGLFPGRTAQDRRGRGQFPVPQRRIEAPFHPRSRRTDIQIGLGADIMMAFDECVAYPCERGGGGAGRGAHHALGPALQGAFPHPTAIPRPRRSLESSREAPIPSCAGSSAEAAR